MGFVRKLTGGKDAKKAAQTSAKASDRATQMTWDMFSQSRNDLAPYRQTGVDALGQMARLYGMPQYGADGKQVAAAGPADYSAFQDSPDYQFSFDEGNRAVNAGLAARGLSNSGRAMKELTRYGQGMASQQLGNYVNRLAAMAGVGQTATTQTGNLGANAATNAGQTTQAAGDARASGYMARAGQNQQLYGQLLNMGMGSGLGAIGGAASGSGAGMGALMGLLGGSARKYKTNIRKVGKTTGGLGVYTYRYKVDPEWVTRMGVMRDEVLDKMPWAATMTGDLETVDYARVS